MNVLFIYFLKQLANEKKKNNFLLQLSSKQWNLNAPILKGTPDKILLGPFSYVKVAYVLWESLRYEGSKTEF